MYVQHWEEKQTNMYFHNKKYTHKKSLISHQLSPAAMYLSNRKYLDPLFAYHICPEIWNSPFYCF